MSRDEFTKLFKYMQEMRSEMSAHFEESTVQHTDIRGAIADLGGQIRDYNQEMLMLARKVDRMEQ